MRLLLVVALSCAIVFSTIFFALSYVSADPSTEALDADIADVRVSVAETEAEVAAYSGGAIQALVQVRLEILRTTVTMLEQKRTSLLRRIDLNYVVEGRRHVPDPTVLAALEVELVEAEAERSRHQAEADRYTGGLIQTVALVNAATSDMAVSQIRLSLLAERYGFLFSVPSSGSTQEPVGQTIVEEDAEAL